MPKLFQISGRELIKKLRRLGYFKTRQKGSHVRLRHNDSSRKPITVPLHKFIKPGLLHRIIKDAGIDIEKFLDL